MSVLTAKVENLTLRLDIVSEHVYIGSVHVYSVTSRRPSCLEELAALITAAADGVDFGDIDDRSRQHDIVRRLVLEAMSTWHRERGLTWDPTQEDSFPASTKKEKYCKQELYLLAKKNGWVRVDESILEQDKWSLTHLSDGRVVRLEFFPRHQTVKRAWLEIPGTGPRYIPYAGYTSALRYREAVGWLGARSPESWRVTLGRAARGVLDTLAMTGSSPEAAASVLRDVTSICAQLIDGVQRAADGTLCQTADGSRWDPADEEAEEVLSRWSWSSRARGDLDACDLGKPLGVWLAEQLVERRALVASVDYFDYCSLQDDVQQG